MTRRLPAEWEDQDGVLLAWPHEKTDWAPMLDEVEAVYADIIRELTRFERVILIVANIKAVTRKLSAAGIPLDRIRLHQAPTDDTWARDFGPITVMEHGRPVLLDFTFTGWGEKFSALRDNAVTMSLVEQGVFLAPCETLDLVLEGGGIESDGNGTLLTTTECLLNQNRNPHLGQAEIEAELYRHFGVERILWLDHGYLAGDDTDAHIDTLARFAPNDTIIYQACTEPDDEHYGVLQAMARDLQAFRSASGQPYRLLPLPWPCACYDEKGERLPATYANFLVINDAVLVPVYDDPADDKALAVISEAFPDRETIGINCWPLIRQHGSLHCVTMQLPRGVLR